MGSGHEYKQICGEYYITLGFFIMIVTLRHDSCSVAKAIIAIFLRAFDAVKKKG